MTREALIDQAVRNRRLASPFALKMLSEHPNYHLSQLALETVCREFRRLSQTEGKG